MTFNDTAAAYGLFQVVFADVVDHLAVATFRLRETREPDLRFEKVFRQEAKNILGQLRDELKQFDERSPVSDNVREVGDACDIISNLAVWRNDRIHARVRMTDSGFALYNWRTRRRLEISHDQIVQNIELAVKAIVTLEAHVQHLVGQMEFDEEVEKLFSTLPEFSERDGVGSDPAMA